MYLNKIQRRINGMKVLSLFDGISCGMVALERCGIPVERYVAYEIEPSAIKVSKDNYPFIEHCGDVTKADFTQYKGFDLVIGGSPCQGFSVAGKQLNFEDERSKLFFEFVRALKEVQPKYFLLENVCMKKEWEEIITEILGVEPIMIESSLLTAGMRKRNYWTNIPGVTQPKDKGVKFQDIIDSGIVENEKAYCLTLRRGNARDYFKKCQSNIVFEPNAEGEYLIQDGKIEIVFKKSPNKSPFVFNVKIPDGRYDIRPISSNESEKLETVPINYTKAISEPKACKCLGNGWTVDVIVHILSGIKIFI
jgi:DNA (cytosine-5)-methyltransferase 3A